MPIFNDDIEQYDLWRSGTHGFHTYCIPALALTEAGTILAFCEGRKHQRSDTGDIALLIKRSMDGGKTWSEQRVIWDDPQHTCGNPAPVVDRATGTIHLLMTWNRGDDRERDIVNGTSKDTRRVFATSSIDNGLTWATSKEITTDVKRPNWTWYATGPGHGIQLQQGRYAGRLVIPCDHIESGANDYYSHVIYSDDNGEHWQLGGRSPKPQVNECEVVEITDGRILLNMRSYESSTRARQIATSNDGGITFSAQHIDHQLIEPICQASILRYPASISGENGLILFANPASEEKRINMTLRASLDDGKNWIDRITLHAGPSAYSDLAMGSDGRVLCLYECGESHPYECLRLAFIELDSRY